MYYPRGRGVSIISCVLLVAISWPLMASESYQAYSTLDQYEQQSNQSYQTRHHDLTRSQVVSSVNEYMANHGGTIPDIRSEAREGKSEAQWVYSKMLRVGFFFDQDQGKAIDYARQSAQQGYVPAQSFLSRALPQHEPDRRWMMEQSAWSGDSEGLFELGRMHLNGYGVTQDVDLGMFYISRAASRNHPEARQLYETLIERQRNRVSIGDLMRNARMGSVESLIDLADAYDEGVIIDRNSEKASRIRREVDRITRKKD